jgi:nitrite reductase (NADH) small subunit
MAAFRRVASVNDIPSGQGTVVEVGGKQIALFNIQGVFHAIDNTCSHRGGPLGEGNLRGTAVTCPWHGTQFNVTNGQVLGPPATSDVASYPTKIEEDSVWVALS